MLEGRFLDRVDLTAGPLRVEAVLHAPMISVRLQHVDLVEVTRTLLRYDEGYRLELSLTPRPTSHVHFLGSWLPHRYEEMGRLFVLPPGQAAQVRAGAGASSAIVCHLHRDICPELRACEPPWTEERLSAGVDVEEARISSTMLRLAEELRHPGFASAALVECYAHEMAIHLHRHFNPVEEPRARGGISPWRLRLIDERLQDASEPPTLTELASLCKLSVRQLSRGFRKNRGISLGDYIVKARLDRAMRLLREGQAIKAVAFAAGFKSPASFSHAFRKATGVTPSAYQADPFISRKGE